tara:strand:+ start:122 stop:286 length:165 start_codon:yes stop_codon:yes gene_type:complete
MLNMKKEIYSNIKDTDALESFFECITSCSINMREWVAQQLVTQNILNPKMLIIL